LLNANASDLLPLRRWDTARYVELAARLLSRFPQVHIAFTGAKEEASAVDKLVAKVSSSRCFSLAGKTTLRQLMVTYGLADVLVTNDSGPAHFASLTTIHTVTLFGPETPLLFAALTPRNTPIWAGLACSPCVSALNNRQSACNNNSCMQRISVDEVFNAVSESYNKRQADRVRLPASTRAVAFS
ncbi:MAG: glycosyl transferase, partial [Chthoniobacteraceae bacterium]|nr:glycosyl transferase [Chthoniobacteraceae bacterium]